MSLTGAAVILGALVLLLLRLHAVRVGSALACAVFGFVLAATPAGPGVQHVLDATGAWLWSSVSTM